MNQIRLDAWRAVQPAMLPVALMALLFGSPAARAKTNKARFNAPPPSAVTQPTLIIIPGETPYIKSARPNVWVRTLDPSSKEGAAYRNTLPGAPGVPTGPVYTELKNGSCVAGRPHAAASTRSRVSVNPTRKGVGKGGRR